VNTALRGLRKLWHGWARVARAIGDFQARALLTLFYFVILAPFALGIRWRSDPLAINVGAPRGWRSRVSPTGAPLDRAVRQF
jgi:hypothetical protein